MCVLCNIYEASSTGKPWAEFAYIKIAPAVCLSKAHKAYVQASSMVKIELGWLADNSLGNIIADHLVLNVSAHNPLDNDVFDEPQSGHFNQPCFFMMVMKRGG
ncbi:hypothetical protein HRM2_01090 [Desulforapulum autotrophicum HRM2]|uniref:Uncharacterized protein n=1 Tax=Desulforapulum autotrophicum (strain ATCC 43914 / DSM 3382 / VKM B-1955 / HRM2) TaxID=177437 RepID=C0QEB5_DESAH|nr:hypothetical protein HRM2_01090 [Desulforapulum autotrophicum HRM2]